MGSCGRGVARGRPRALVADAAPSTSSPGSASAHDHSYFRLSTASGLTVAQVQLGVQWRASTARQSDSPTVRHLRLRQTLEAWPETLRATPPLRSKRNRPDQQLQARARRWCIK